jgi:hypothetical protein
MGNITYKFVSREITKERLFRYSLGGIFIEEKVVEFVLLFSQFCNGYCICDVCHVRILLYLWGINGMSLMFLTCTCLICDACCDLQ